MLTEILIKSFTVVVSAIAGAGVLFFIKLDHRKLCALISFSAGALMSAALFALLPESYNSLGIIELAASALSGYLLFFLISKYYSHVCPACAASHFDEITTHKFSEIVLTLLTALSIHSFLDGVAITSGNINGHVQDESIFAAIAVHKFPEGLALAALMFSAGYRKGKVLFYVILVELVTVAGAVAGLFFLKDDISTLIMGIVIAHIGGGFIYLAVHAVLGEMIKNHKNLVMVSFSLGLALIFVVHIIT